MTQGKGNDRGEQVIASYKKKCQKKKLYENVNEII
jgi:hypothetical protein